jgi:hypothetical protein
VSKYFYRDGNGEVFEIENLRRSSTPGFWNAIRIKDGVSVCVFRQSIFKQEHPIEQKPV